MITISKYRDESNSFVDAYYDKVLQEIKRASTGKSEFTGWMNVGERCKTEWIENIKTHAEYIRNHAEIFVVVGVGGSNNAARAAITALADKCDREIVFAGTSISAWELEQKLKNLKSKRIHVNIIAKNFETLEPGIAFRIIRNWMRKEIGPDYSKYITAIGTKGSLLERICLEEGYYFFPFPDDIGGRFSAISEVGLLPMAVAGLRIEEIVKGAAEEEQQLLNESYNRNQALLYATLRYKYYSEGYKVEFLSSFEPRLNGFGKWWMQLYGESEGKNNNGLFPMALSYTEDLHSLGQYIQEGSRIGFETFLHTIDKNDLQIPCEPHFNDGFDYLNEKELRDINEAAYQATLKAHSSRIPCLVISTGDICEYNLGGMFYFFEFSCFCSAKLLGVNPFNQPGVEQYKKNMFEILGRKNVIKKN